MLTERDIDRMESLLTTSRAILVDEGREPERVADLSSRIAEVQELRRKFRLMRYKLSGMREGEG